MNGFASDSANIAADYGRAAFDTRNRAMIGGSFTLPYNFRISPFVIATSGRPYNLTAGQDLNGDSILNDRPYFCPAAGGAGCITTPLGSFATSPVAGATLVPVNFGNSPGSFTFNARLGKTFGLGPKLEKNAAAAGQAGHQHGGPGGNPFGGGMGGGRGGPFGGDTSDRRYNLTFNVLVRNLFNNVNPAAPIGNITSPFFAQSIALAGGPFGSGSYNRRIDLQVQFSF